MTLPGASDLTASGGDRCGALSNANFGTLNPGFTYSTQMLNGLRPWDYQVGIALQQQLTPRISAEVQWNKRWFEGYYVSRNLAVHPADWTTYSITAPVDSRLPGGGGYTVSGLHDIVPAFYGQVNYQIQPATNYGDGYQYWSGVDLTLAVRASKGITFQGGTSTGQTVQDICGVSNQLPDALLASQSLAVGVSMPGFRPLGSGQAGMAPGQYCHLASGFLTQFRGLARTGAEGRRRSLGLVPEQTGRAARRPTTTCRRRIIAQIARPRAVGRRRERQRQPHHPGLALWRPRERARPAVLEDPAFRGTRTKICARPV